MTDVSVLPGSHPTRRDLTSEDARARVRRRYRSEARFRWYGIAALVVTTIFLVTLIADILIKGLPAFTQHSLSIDVPVTAEMADPEGNRSEQSLRSGDYTGLVRNAVKAELGVDGRVATGHISKILSTGAGDALRRAVVADPSLIGQTVKTTALLSDDADLYYKGVGTVIERADGAAAAKPSDVKGEITVTAPGAFAAEVASLRERAATTLKELEAQIALYDGSSDQAVRDRATPLITAAASQYRGAAGSRTSIEA